MRGILMLAAIFLAGCKEMPTADQVQVADVNGRNALAKATDLADRVDTLESEKADLESRLDEAESKAELMDAEIQSVRSEVDLVNTRINRE